MATMDVSNLSNRVVVVQSTIPCEDEEYPSYNADDICLLFGDIATPKGYVLNKGGPRECNAIFSESGYIPEVLKLLDDPQWVGKHLHLTLHRSKKETLPIIVNLLGGQPLEKGEEYDFFPVEQDLEGVEGPPTSTPKRERTLLFLNWSNTLNLFIQMN